jgi:hypothetical protein
MMMMAHVTYKFVVWKDKILSAVVGKLTAALRSDICLQKIVNLSLKVVVSNVIVIY